MNHSINFRLSAALTVPFKANLQIDNQCLIDHAKSLLTRGCECITLGGTTGEGTSLSAVEKFDVLDKMIEAGIPIQKIGLAAFGNDLDETTQFIDRSLSYDISHLLVAQPFYFKNPSPQGITDWYDYVFSAVGSKLKNIILYNIPSCTAVDLPHETITFLLDKYGDAIIGLKESSGDKDKTLAYQQAFPNLSLYVGSEIYLGEMVAKGAIGAISGCANFIPEVISDIINNKRDNEDVIKLVKDIVSHPVTPAVKFFVAEQYGNSEWLRVRPPLVSINDDVQKSLAENYNSLSF